MFDLAAALHSRRSDLAEAAADLTRLRETVGSPGDLSLGQWFQLYATTLAYQPAAVLELGRGLGNSTAAFTAAAARLPATRVVSVGYDHGEAWKSRTAPKLKRLVGESFFEPLEIHHADIRDVDFAAVLGAADRVLLWWDAHGTDLAWFVLGELLPILCERAALVCAHDISDSRFEQATTAYHREDGSPIFWMGDLVSPFQEIGPLFDFLSRNHVDFTTPQRSFAAMKAADEPSWRELNETLSPRAADALQDGGWLYFDPVGATTFPRYVRDFEELIEGEPTGAFARVRSQTASRLRSLRS